MSRAPRSIWSCFTVWSLNSSLLLRRFLCWVFICYLKEELREKVLEQKTQVWGFSFMCVPLVWSFRCEMALKDLPQPANEQR